MAGAAAILTDELLAFIGGPSGRNDIGWLGIAAAASAERDERDCDRYQNLSDVKSV